MSAFFSLLGSLCVKAAHKMSMKLTPGVNFINVLCKVFTLIDPKRVKKIDNLNVIFMHLGVKAACKTLMKLTPVVNFTNNLKADILYKSVLSSFFYLQFGFVIFLANEFWQKKLLLKCY